jgi:diguanylate cyclase (GGDEF)-like protein/PAS domain S-box-containing protein
MRSIRLSSINVCAVAFLGIALGLLSIGSLSLKASAEKAKGAAEAEKRIFGLREELSAASNSLTDRARAFTATRDRADLEAFCSEKEAALKRDAEATESMLGRMGTEEVALLEEATRDSKILSGIEYRALRLMVEALGYQDREIPSLVAAVALSSADASLPKARQAELARELLFGAPYLESKRRVQESIGEILSLARKRAAAEASAAEEASDRIDFLVKLSCFLAFFGASAVLFLYYRLAALPVRNYVKALTTIDPATGYPELKPEGSRELADLAETINLRRAQRLRAERAFRDTELRLKTNLYMMPLGAMETDRSNRITTWNRAAERMFGFTEEEALGRDLLDLIVPERLKTEVGAIIDKLKAGEDDDQHINANLTKDGREIICEWHNAPLYDSEGEWIGWASLVKDITQQRAEEEEIRYLSGHDPLTGLLNRRSMNEKLDEERGRSARTGGAYSILMLDIDRFKNFNDAHGHECGDLVLKEVAEVMLKTARSTDSVGRWGGEEFLILLPDTDLRGALELAEKIRRHVEEHEVSYNEEKLRVTVTAGVAARSGDLAVGNGEGESVEDCIRRADTALLAGKSAGRNRVVEA